ncbi:MAG: hypothetical protein PHN69_01445 [Candidatus Pacebacteria bacterium]|nr:hypothetical protein [Candidatus Paceibacterota bacterium]
MNMKRREKWSCGRKNRKFRGENLNARGYSYDKSDPVDSNRLDVLPRGVLHQIFRSEIERGIEDAMNHSASSDRRHLFSRVDPEYAMKVEDRKVFAKACDCGAVTVDRCGHVHHHLLPRSVRRKRHEERVRRREEALREIAC